jgi:hypothetical protein
MYFLLVLPDWLVSVVAAFFASSMVEIVFRFVPALVSGKFQDITNAGPMVLVNINWSSISIFNTNV